jgi:hypothetical protein
MRSVVRILLALSLPLSACQVIRHPGVVLDSEPPGARVVISGKDSGFVTPCAIELPRKRQRVEILLDGYKPVVRQIDPEQREWLILWDESYHTNKVWRFPLWLNFVDLFGPLKIERAYSPGRVFVRLRRSEAE